MSTEQISSFAACYRRATIHHQEQVETFGHPVVDEHTIHAVLGSIKDRMDLLTKSLREELGKLETQPHGR